MQVFHSPSWANSGDASCCLASTLDKADGVCERFWWGLLGYGVRFPKLYTTCLVGRFIREPFHLPIGSKNSQCRTSHAVCFLLWLEDFRPLQFIEFFAGQAAATRKFKESGFATARLDIDYMRGTSTKENPMDLLTDCGFASLVEVYGHVGYLLYLHLC